jgi:hypothetical protein
MLAQRETFDHFDSFTNRSVARVGTRALGQLARKVGRFGEGKTEAR